MEKIVPFMAVMYLGAGLVIIGFNADKIGWAFEQIVVGAFTASGIAGGVVGASIQGFKRAAFSNEAGIGSAAIAHSAVKTRESITEGCVSPLEPFIDTVVICTLTALVITISGHLSTGLTGVELASAAFSTAFSWFPYVLVVTVLLFAFSTMISWSYPGLKAWTHPVGEGEFAELIFKFSFCVCVVIGSSMSLGPVIDFSDSMIFAVAIPNVIGLYMLMSFVREASNQGWRKIETGEIGKVGAVKPKVRYV